MFGHRKTWTTISMSLVGIAKHLIYTHGKEAHVWGCSVPRVYTPLYEFGDFNEC